MKHTLVVRSQDRKRIAMQEQLKRDAVCNAVKRMVHPSGANGAWMRSQLYAWLGKSRTLSLLAQPYVSISTLSYEYFVIRDDLAFLEVLEGYATITHEESLKIQAEMTLGLLEDV